MSYSFGFTCTAKTFSDECNGPMEFALKALEGEPNEDETAAAVQVALQAAKDLIDSGQFGSGDFSVNIGGHAEPDHKQREGWADDCVSIYVSHVNKQP